MDKEPVLLNVEDRIAWITLNRPDRHNAFNSYVIEALTDVFTELESHPNLVAAVLAGNGESFSAGADLNWMKQAAEATEEKNQDDALDLSRMLHRLYTLPAVTIARVQGTAMGGGLGLVSCCDVVAALSETTFAFSEVKLGLIPATISPYVLAATGPGPARRYFQTGEQFSSPTAQEVGLVHEVFETGEEMDNFIERLLEDLQKNGIQAMKQAKRLCLDYAYRPVTEDLLEDAAQRIARARTSDEGREGVRAFLEDRSPDWKQANEDNV